MTISEAFKILGVNYDNSLEEIKSKYRKMAKQYHPDIYSNNDATSKMQEINEAYNVLSDDEKRKQYDEELREKRELAKEKIQENIEQMQNNFNASNTENMSESERRFRDMQRRRYEEIPRIKILKIIF